MEEKGLNIVLTARKNNIEIEIHSIVKHIILFCMPITFVETRDKIKNSHADVCTNLTYHSGQKLFLSLVFKQVLNQLDELQNIMPASILKQSPDLII